MTRSLNHHVMRSILLSLIFSCFCACALTPSELLHTLPQDALSTDSCRTFFQALDSAVTQAHVRDGQYYHWREFPYLRSTRFLSALQNTSMSDAQFAIWLQKMRELDQQARRLELQNLFSVMRLPLAQKTMNSESILKQVSVCGERLTKTDISTLRQRQQSHQLESYPDDYVTWLRWLGVYPLSSQLMKLGIRRYQKDIQQLYTIPISQLPTQGKLIRYTAQTPFPKLEAQTIADILQSSARNNALEFPEPAEEELKLLFSQFAPVLEIDTLSDADRIGSVRLLANGASQVDIQQPSAYHYTSYTIFSGRKLLQLNYTFWFPERPRQKALDLYAGHLDGIVWRVTLDTNGAPIVYDAIHPCGCYHMFFPVQGFTLRPQAKKLPEPPLVPQAVAAFNAQKYMIIRISALEHMIQRVYLSDEIHAAQYYRLSNYDQLRSLPLDQQRYASMFDTNGIVKHTQRSERFLLWTTGVRKTGSMRQQGRQVVAFRGRRHFDDAYLFDQLFMFQAPPAP